MHSTASLSVGNAEEEISSASRLRFHPNASAVPLDDSFADSQPHSGAGVFAVRMQALEDSEDGLLISGRHADAVVPDVEPPLVVHSSGGQFDLDLFIGLSIFKGISNQVLEYLGQMAFAHSDHGHVAYGDLCIAFLNRGREIVERPLQRLHRV